MAQFLVPSTSLSQTIFTEDVPELKAIQEELDGTYWRPDEMDFSKDLEHWRTLLTASERQLVENAVLEFNIWDIVVGQVYTGGGSWTLGDNQGGDVSSFVDEIKSIQLTSLYAMVAAWEVIHSRTYSLIGMTLLGRERMKFLVTSNLPTYIQNKAKWYVESMKSNYTGEVGTREHIRDHARRVVVNCAVEGLFFQPKFTSIYWLKKKGLMPALAQANELISRDEGLHTRLAAVYYKLLGSPLTPQEITSIFTQAAELECEGVMETHPEDLVGLSKETLCQYVRHSCDFLLTMVNDRPLLAYNVPNPYQWMVSTSVTRQTSFFERRVTEYESRGKSREKSLVFLDKW
jgi:ribonucleoside-diphosphate reductase subunit M2